ncbi:MAG: elongation factor G [Sphaerochaetaceae bacterium]|nr:elongation factor G [Spirochaetales bacterium]MDY5499255.1 elongation factor G [Sphaerochaetaceae bacterium]
MGVISSDIRNVAIVGHNGTGKTTLVEQLLFQAGALDKPATVESGKTVSDFTDEEIAKKISIHSSLISFYWNDRQINLLDTPGTSGFIGEAICAFRSCESALMVIDAEFGIQIETLKLWRRLNNRNKPRAVFINKMDKERADFDAVLEQLKERFKMAFVPIAIPIGKGADFKGVVNLIENKAYLPGTDGRCSSYEVPSELHDLVEKYRGELIESAAEGADDLLEKYFEEGTLSEEDIRRGLHQGVKVNKVVPVLCGCASKGMGMHTLLNCIKHDLPDPTGETEWIMDKNGVHHDMAINPDGPAAAYCFKTTIDQFNGKLSFLKVVSGSIGPETDLIVRPRDKRLKPGKVYRMVGRKLVETDVLNAGDIGVITKADAVSTNSTLLGDLNATYTFQPLAMPSPVYTLAISTDDKKAEVKMGEALYRVAEEDITFHTGFNEETKESYVAGLSEGHLKMILEKIEDKQKIKINTKLPRVAYRETITKDSGLTEYTHKKQTGGHGQYAKVVLSIAPSERGALYTFNNVVKGGAISKGYVPGIEKGIHEQMEEGFLAGYPIVDVAVTLIDGKEHPVDSSEMAFKLAGKGAMRAALAKAGCVLLEPIMSIQIYVDQEYLGAILSDLSSKRGRVLGQEETGQLQVVKALVPQSEVLNYAIDLKSMTSGTGSFELEFDHYEQLHGKQADEVIAEGRKHMKADEE